MRRVGARTPLPDNEQQLRVDLLTTMLERLSSARPTLLIAEDCHWADTADVELLIDLIDAQARRPVMLAATERREHETVDAGVASTRYRSGSAQPDVDAAVKKRRPGAGRKPGERRAGRVRGYSPERAVTRCF